MSDSPNKRTNEVILAPRVHTKIVEFATEDEVNCQRRGTVVATTLSCELLKMGLVTSCSFMHDPWSPYPKGS